MIIFGHRASKIGTINVKSDSCDYCNTSESQNLWVYGRYAHVFWIPMFPFGKKIFAECSHCKKTIGKREFSQKLKDSYKLSKEQVKTPIWHWSGLIIVSLLILAIFILGKTA